MLLLGFLKLSLSQFMSNNTRKIITAFILLLCFSTGQIIVFTHSHVTSLSNTSTSKDSKPVATDDNCKICQLNHTATPLLNIDLPNTVIYGTAYKQLEAESLSYQSISLILAATRGPPIA